MNTRVLTSFMLLMAFAMAPLAQAVECVMSQPVMQDCPMSRTEHGRMTVGDCFTALKSGVMPATVTPPHHDYDNAALVPAPLLVEKPLVIAALVPVRDRLLHAPPDDIILLTARRRI